MNFDLMNATPQFVKENKAYDFYVEIVYDFYNKYTDEDFVFLITKNKFELSNEKIEVPQVQLIELYVQLKEPILIRQLESCEYKRKRNQMRINDRRKCNQIDITGGRRR